jgi:hypothetical protein
MADCKEVCGTDSTLTRRDVSIHYCPEHFCFALVRQPDSPGLPPASAALAGAGGIGSLPDGVITPVCSSLADSGMCSLTIPADLRPRGVRFDLPGQDVDCELLTGSLVLYNHCLAIPYLSTLRDVRGCNGPKFVARKVKSSDSELM